MKSVSHTMTNRTAELPNSAPITADKRRFSAFHAALRRIIRAIDLYSKKVNKETGLTGPQWLVMNEIQLHDSIMVKDLADNINLSPATVTTILDRLEQKSLIERQRSRSDKRRLKLHLTSRGVTMLTSAPKLLQRHFVEQFAALETVEQRQMIAMLERIAQMMDSPSDLTDAPAAEPLKACSE